MLAVDEPASHIDWRTLEPADPQRIKTNSGTNGVHYRIDSPHLVKLNILRRDVMNVSFRYREFHKDSVSDALRVGVQSALADHGKNLRGLVMVMMVAMRVRVIVIMMAVADDDIKLHGADIGAHDA